MFQWDDQSGIMIYLVGIIVLVMAAVGLSVVNDKHGKSGHERQLLREEISSGAAEIAELGARLEHKDGLWQAAQQRAQRAQPVVRQDFAQRREAGLAAKARLAREIGELEKSFAEYRSRQRRLARAAAVGTSLGELAVRGGRTYREAVIARVTDSGLEIRHQDGTARISSADLETDLHDRFQWDPREAAPAAVVAETPAPTPPRKKQRVAKPEVDAEKLQLAREQVVGWTARVRALHSEHREAASRAGSGFRQSVPGSLETWGAKAQRLQRDLGRAQVALAQARALSTT